MPSSSHYDGRASASSSWQTDPASSHSRSRPDPSPDHSYRRPRQSGDRHRSPARDYRDHDRHTSSGYRLHDDRRPRPAYDSPDRDDYHYSHRAHSPPRSHYDSTYRDHYDSKSYRSSDPSRRDHRPRSPSPSRGPRDGRDTGSYSSASDHRLPRPRESDRPHAYSSRRSETSPPPARSSGSRRGHDSDRHRHDNYDDSSRRHRHDDHRSSTRNGRDRSPSRDRHRDRSRERSQDRHPERSRSSSHVPERKQGHRSSTTESRSHSTRDDDRSAPRLNGRSEDSKILKRKSEPEPSVSQPTPPESRDISAKETAKPAHIDRIRDEPRLPVSKTSQDSDSTRSPSDNANDIGKSAASNGSATTLSRSDHAHPNGSTSQGWRPITSKQAATEPRPRSPAPESSRTDSKSSHKETAVVLKRSFGHVPLPYELPPEVRGKNWMATSSYKEGTRPVFKSAADKNLIDAITSDPRRSAKMPPSRNTLYAAKFRWDRHSVGEKPLPPPRNLVLTDLPAILLPNQILLHVRPHGRIESSQLEISPRTGQSIGIFRVTFAHDYDEHGKALENLPTGQELQNGALAARAAASALSGYRIGTTTIRTFLDRDGEVLGQKVKEKLAAQAEAEAKQRRETAPASAPAPTPAARVSSSPATPSAAKPNMPPPNVPRGPRASVNAAASSPSVRTNTYSSEHSTPAHQRYKPSYDDARPRHEDARRSAHVDPLHRRRGWDEHDSSYSKHHAHRDAARQPSSRMEPRTKQKQSSEEIKEELRQTQRAFVFIPRPKNCDVALEDVQSQLRSTEPIWVKEGDDGFYAAFNNNQEASKCKIVNETLSIGGYTLQVDVRYKLPPRSEAPSNGAASKMSTHPSSAAPAQQPTKKIDIGLRPLTDEEKLRGDWTAAQLQDAVFRLLQMELAETFVRDVKSRVVGPHVAAYLKTDAEGGQLLAKATLKKTVAAVGSMKGVRMTSEADGEARLPSFRKLAGTKPKKVSDADTSVSKKKKDVSGTKGERETAPKSRSHRVKDISSSEDESEDARRDRKASARRDSGTRSKSSTKRRGAAAWLLDSADEEADSDDAAATERDATSRSVSASVEPAAADHVEAHADAKSKKGSKAKAASAVKKKGATSARKGVKVEGTPSEADVEAEQRDDTATPETDVPAKATKTKTKPARATAKAKPIPADPFEAGLVEDSEDCYYLRLALEHLDQKGELASEETLPDEVELEAEAEEQAVAAGAIPKHSTGSARTEGYYRIPPEQKAMHLPDRNKATEDVDTGSNAQVLQSARNNRADSRRLVLGIEQHKRETATDTDMFKFNQLRTRKKQLKFAKSPIHDWGLYAMEFIPAGDMVIEYVGEVVRQQVADEREKQYERQGNFSTYLFRVDDDLVVDATHKGNIARLMNHCCTPNCNAKILTLNGEKRIVLFAKSPIRAGEELTYDYKFQSSADDEDAIPCLCGSPGCRRFL
ncbi:related to regulatory protein SET1 [Sporisorium reilianum SRZ2]|uniref:Histone-lysine N-methyltransferase, H3 lysine-4 specific n=1 Tax=Sporisorium reilianum (strain SRZ2) TaxID=999809 RepID=E7A0Q4_SPORE|nr:related to regulatory protein SET1 [Sporisorium reilianum SRZ2]